MSLRTLITLVLLTATPGLAGNGKWIAVVAPGLQAEIHPLAEQRRAEGWEVTVIVAAADPEPALKQISGLAAKGGPCCVVLAGDFSPEAGEFRVPTGLGVHLRMKNKPSDYPWSAVARGSMVEVGRLPAADAAGARALISKILKYPRDLAGGDSFPAVHLIAGHHGAPPTFAGIADSLNNSLSLRLLEKLPAAWRFDGAVHIDGSPWQISGDDVPAVAREMMSDGAALLAYMGHSLPDGAESKSKALLRGKDWQALPPDGPRPGLFFTCGCYSCELSPGVESYGFAAIRAPGGPPAVIGSQGLTWAAMGYLAISGLIDRIAADPPPVRLGTLWLGVRKGLAEGEISGPDFAMLDMADGTNGKVPLDQQRLEHLESWMLLGDPAMPLLPPAPVITIDPPSAPMAGKPLTVTGILPADLAGAMVRITFERHPSTLRAGLPEIPASGPDRLAATRERRRLSTDVVLASASATAKGTIFTTQLDVPSPLPPGPWTLRAETVNPARGGILQIRN